MDLVNQTIVAKEAEKRNGRGWPGRSTKSDPLQQAVKGFYARAAAVPGAWRESVGQLERGAILLPTEGDRKRLEEVVAPQ
jgi:hypothetical protein